MRLIYAIPLLCLAQLETKESREVLKPLINGLSLVEKDWCDWREGDLVLAQQKRRSLHRLKTYRFRVLSLKPGKTWDEGAAWLINFDAVDGVAANFQALKGVYQFYHNPKVEETLLLRLGFIRKYTGEMLRGRLEWQIDNSYTERPTGVTVEIPLEGNRVPEGVLTVVVAESYRVDGAGARLTRASESLPFIPKKNDKEFTGHLLVGETFKMTDKYLVDEGFRNTFDEVLLKAPPPGFRLHEKPKDPFDLGNDAMVREQYKDAVEQFTLKIHLDPTHAMAHHNRGQAYELTGDLDRAIADFTETIRLDPTSFSALRNRGLLYMKRRLYANAKADFAEAIRIKPDDVVALRSIALIYAAAPLPKMRDPLKGYTHAKYACKLTNNRDPDCLAAMAAVQAELTQFDRALSYQTRAVSMVPIFKAGPYRAPIEPYLARKPFRLPEN